MAAYVQSNSTAVAAGVASVALGVRSTANDIYTVGVEANVPAATVVAITDNAGNTYMQLAPPAPTEGTYTLFTFICIGIKLPVSGVTTVTSTITGGAGLQFLIVGEYAGPNTLDAGSYATNGGTLSGNLQVSTTLANAGEMLIAFVFSLGQSTLSAGSGWTMREYTGTLGFVMLLDQLTGPAAGAQTLTPSSQSGANAWNVSVSGFYTPAPGPPATTALFPLPVYKAIGIL